MLNKFTGTVTHDKGGVFICRGGDGRERGLLDNAILRLQFEKTAKVMLSRFRLEATASEAV
jgi:hypothetical protein